MAEISNQNQPLGKTEDGNGAASHHALNAAFAHLKLRNNELEEKNRILARKVQDAGMSQFCGNRPKSEMASGTTRRHSQIDEQESLINHLKERCQIIESNNEQLSDENDKLKKEIAALTQVNRLQTDLNEKIRKLDNENEDHIRESLSSQKKIQFLEKQLAELRVANQKLEEEKQSTFQKQFDDVLKSMPNSESILEVSILESLKDELLERRTQLTQLRKVIKSQQQLITQLHRKEEDRAGELRSRKSEKSFRSSENNSQFSETGARPKTFKTQGHFQNRISTATMCTDDLINGVPDVYGQTPPKHVLSFVGQSSPVDHYAGACGGEDFYGKRDHIQAWLGQHPLEMSPVNDLARHDSMEHLHDESLTEDADLLQSLENFPSMNDENMESSSEYDNMNSPRFRNREQSIPGGVEAMAPNVDPDYTSFSKPNVVSDIENRFRPNSTAQQPRPINIDRNEDVNQSKSYDNKSQNVNINVSSNAENKPSDIFLNNDPLCVSMNKAIPPKNIFVEESIDDKSKEADDEIIPICPVCNCDFPSISMSEFQQHVLECSDSPQDTAAGGTTAIFDDRVCPVCQDSFLELLSQNDFEQHVNSHFENEDRIIDDFGFPTASS